VVDFPDNWPGLFDQLLAMIGAGEVNQVHGVMKVLDELANDITDNQVGRERALGRWMERSANRRGQRSDGR